MTGHRGAPWAGDEGNQAGRKQVALRGEVKGSCSGQPGLPQAPTIQPWEPQGI